MAGNDNDNVKKENGMALLTQLGINEKFIPKGKTEEEYERLYRLLRIPMRYFANSFEISAEWQLSVLLTFLNKNKKEDFDLQSKDIDSVNDSWGNTIAHYAAWSGNTGALDWVKKNFPDLLTVKGNHGRTIAHFAAWSGNTEALRWVEKKFPNLLTAKDNYGYTIAHYAALSGNPEALEWVKNNFQNLLTAKDNYGYTIAHYAALSGNPEALDWIKKNFPDLLTAKNNFGNTIAHYAALSENSDVFNQALFLSGTPEIFQVKSIRDISYDQIASCILRALETNRTLMWVTFLGNYDGKLKNEIIKKLIVNQIIYNTDFNVILKELKLLDERITIDEDDKRRFNSVLNFHNKKVLFDAIKKLDQQYQIPLLNEIMKQSSSQFSQKFWKKEFEDEICDKEHGILQEINDYLYQISPQKMDIETETKESKREKLSKHPFNLFLPEIEKKENEETSSSKQDENDPVTRQNKL